MKKAAIIIILLLYLSMILHYPLNFQNNLMESRKEKEEIKVVYDNNKNTYYQVVTEKNNGLIMGQHMDVSFKGEIGTLDLQSPSYTNVSVSGNTSIIEGTEVTLTSQTISLGHGVSSGEVDFNDLKILKIDNDTTSGVLYSNRFAVKIALPVETTIEGFAVNITPTIREDINFYIRTSLTGENLKQGLITGYIGNSAHITKQMLYVPFSYCSEGSPLILNPFTDYYFILEPTISTSNTFFELKESENTPDNVVIYEWWNSNYKMRYGDVNFCLITQMTTIAENVVVSSSGVAIANWEAINLGDHVLLAWYKRSTFYGESFGTSERIVLPSNELFNVNLNPIVTHYLDYTLLQAEVFNQINEPVVGKTITFYIHSTGQSWNAIGSAVTNNSGSAQLTYQFLQNPGNYSLKAKINEISYTESYLLIESKNVNWENIDFNGQFRNNPGAPSYTKLEATITAKDNKGNPIPNMDFELWFKINGVYVWIPHYFTTNSSGQTKIIQAIANLTPGAHIESHYFKPANYQMGYVGNSVYGNTIVTKGILTISLQDYFVKWNQDVVLESQVVTLGEGWAGIVVEFYYFQSNSWHHLGTGTSNSTGHVQYIWNNLPLIYGNYLIRAQAHESTLFGFVETTANLFVDKAEINLYILKNGELKGNGEEIDLEFTSTMQLSFYICYEDGTPASNILISIKGRLVNEEFYVTLGYITTNATGYAYFSNYQTLNLVGYQYLFRADVPESNHHEATILYFKINLTKCTPIIYFEDHLCVKGTSTVLIAQLINCEGRPLRNVQIHFTINGLLFEGTTDYYGYVRVTIAPTLPVGQHQIICKSIEDEFYHEVIVSAKLVISKGTPHFMLYDSAAIEDGLLTIQAKAVDSLGRPLIGLSVRIVFQGWTEILTTDSKGVVKYIIQIHGLECGQYFAMLNFDGDSNWFDALVTAVVIIYEEESSIEILTPDINTIYGEEITIRAELTTLLGLPLKNRLVIFYSVCLNGTLIYLGEGLTDQNGIVSLIIQINLKPCEYLLRAYYPGATDYGPTYNESSLVVQKIDSEIISNDVQAIIDSTTSFSATLIDSRGQSICNEKIYLYIWIDNAWLLLGSFTSNQFGFVEISILVPFPVGTYLLKIGYYGSDYYNNYTLEINMTVIISPPKVQPELEISFNNNSTIVDGEEILFEVHVPNALKTASIVVHVFVNGFNIGTFIIMDGFGHYLWVADDKGIFNITFVSLEDSVYQVSYSAIFIEVIQNDPPELLGYYYYDVICEGEEFTIEARFFDMSGIKRVWFTTNGTIHEMVIKANNIYIDTISFLKKGIYIITICAEDVQGFLSIYETKQLVVIDKKTQVIKHNLNSKILEIGQNFRIDVLLYTEYSISNVFFMINSTKYTMIKNFQLDAHKSDWYFTINTLKRGTYELKIMIVDVKGNEFSTKISETITIIPTSPQIAYLAWKIQKNQGTDYISGSVIIDSFYEIELIEIWINGDKIPAMESSNETYSFENYCKHAKTYILRIKVTDGMGRVLLDELTLRETLSYTILLASIIASVIIVILLAFGIFLLLPRLKKPSDNEFATTLGLLDIESYNSIEEIVAKNSKEVVEHSSQNKTQSKDFGLFPGISPSHATTRESKEELIVADEATDLIDVNFDVESVEVTSRPEIVQVKEYIAKVREDGLIPTNGDSKNTDEKKSIDDLASLAAEIDCRLLPEKEQYKKLAEKEKAENSCVMNLRDITEEIEQTFINKK